MMLSVVAVFRVNESSKYFVTVYYKLKNHRIDLSICLFLSQFGGGYNKIELRHHGR